MTANLNKDYPHQLSCGHIFHSSAIITAGEVITCRPCDYKPAVIEHCIRWQAKCHHCLMCNNFISETNAMEKAHKHVARYTMHVVKIIGPLGNILFLVGADRVLSVDLRVS